MTRPQASLELGIVVERRRLDNPWRDHEWRAVAAIVGGPETEEWRLLDQGPDHARYYAGRLSLELYRKDTDGYRLNLSQPEPKLYVALRPDSGDRPQLFKVTASPHDAEVYEVDGERLIDAVPMPQDLQALLAGFVAEHHVEQPFHKRQRVAGDAMAREPSDRPKGAAKGSRHG